VQDILHFFPQTTEDSISFLYASEKTGFRHLYMVTSELHTSGQATMGQQIGQGDGADNNYVWTHRYVTSYREPTTPVCLTEHGYSHTVQLSKDFSQFVTVFSSLESPPESAVYKLTFDTLGTTGSAYMGHITRKPTTIDYKPPVLFHYPSRAGHTAYGLYFHPHGLEPGKRYPTVLFVYGGPCVQLVTNSFKGQKFLRLHTLAADGYAVVVIDGRGSTNRGLKFEGVLKNQLGTVEIEDQVEGLLWLASQVQFIDMSRVAIYGWSYGGYMSLMGLAQRPDIFKVAISGAPVVSWELYDSGYTERYIGLPLTNPDVYKAGNVLTYIKSLPDDETRLLLIHSLKDENVHFHHSSALINKLVKCCKPYQLLTYPNERHGIRDNEANEHYKTMVLKFLQDSL
ncbi:dipeptidyl peptidase, partial [Elysia marginata]